MKKILFLSLFLCVGVCSWAQTVIDFPKIAGRNTQIVDITKVELLPDATVLHITATNTPTLWVKFSSESVLKDAYSSRTYKYLRIDGYPIDTEYYMPEGRKEFKMYFEPLDDDITRFDFVEGYESRAFRVYGVEIRPDSRPYISEYNYRNFIVENVNAVNQLSGRWNRSVTHSNNRVRYYQSEDLAASPSARTVIIVPAETVRKLRRGNNLIIEIMEE